MSEIWMFTAPAKSGILNDLAKAWRDYDGKRYQIGLEKGRNGYLHIQGRVQLSADTSWTKVIRERVGKRKIERKQSGSHFFDRCSVRGIHVQKSEQWCEYESKDGYYITSDDTQETRLERFGNPTHQQKRVLNVLESNNDREVTVWYDEDGNIGKSWLTGHLWERHKAHYVRMVGSSESMIKDVASKMSKERRPIVVIDVPRATKWNNQLYEAIEVIKDGLIDDPRYTSKALNIKGVKVLVMTNTKPKLDKLSKDRWVFV